MTLSPQGKWLPVFPSFWEKWPHHTNSTRGMTKRRIVPDVLNWIVEVCSGWPWAVVWGLRQWRHVTDGIRAPVIEPGITSSCGSSQTNKAKKTCPLPLMNNLFCYIWWKFLYFFLALTRPNSDLSKVSCILMRCRASPEWIGKEMIVYFVWHSVDQLDSVNRACLSL